ncbi:MULTISPECIES: extracellular solute-binding protein [unclassified Bradyrhizobium]|uniref:ABC transporter substrate-binding protein n=1 Tax=unclassified Bradyrhizobium TaxID=2631580 RepID=UPI00247A038E|nr:MULTISPECIES: extracellular solute-binding protein [unclassified Bradyrhizobium]WGR96652.1 extracellular solute-binding protein [Bradyrhizobium sp. ISRA436]WGS03539.1 extracellular solute-binding protein [Bradyrhizobium sp. ISRA437]WGS10423.1 extracellular solute-binding protein [Bradyrhizobium sp. ISRA443]WGS17614.1 extracellular solute-binding protein [Bradyrhizobium sp. ISRA463]WGS24399.1 extracellular solute-binding protein [Bradyrhizobium sp. ISRA464]
MIGNSSQVSFRRGWLSRRGILGGGAALLGGAMLPRVAMAATTVNVEIDAGQNQNPFRWQADAIKRQFGLDLKLIGLPFVGQYEKLVSELTARSAAYDLLVFPPYFLGDFVALGFLRDLDQYTKIIDPQLDDYLPVYRDPVIKRNGKLYALMYDGDMLQVTYRTDLFDNAEEKKNFKAKYGWDLAPAKNWDQFMQIAEFFTRPPKLYGTAFYAQRGFCYAWFINIFAGLGGHWFTDDMKPGINSDVGVKALEMLVKQKQYAPPNILQIDYPGLNEAFLNGSTAMVVQWDDLALKVGDPKMSKVVGKGGYAACPSRTYMPYSRVMAVSAFSKNPENAYKVAAHMQLPDVGVTYIYDSECGEDPYRKSSLKPEAAMKNHEGKPALDAASAKSYVEAMGEGLKDGYPELSIPGAPRYLDILDLYVSQALAGSLAPKAALDAAANEWKSITQAEDPDAQKAAYAAWVKSFKEVGLNY